MALRKDNVYNIQGPDELRDRINVEFAKHGQRRQLTTTYAAPRPAFPEGTFQSFEVIRKAVPDPEGPITKPWLNPKKWGTGQVSEL